MSAERRLLFLGDNPESAPIVQTALNMGVKPIVVGIRKDTLPKRLAFRAYDVNALDVDALVQIAEKEQCTGAMVGVADILVPSYVEVCRRLGLPCYATEEAVKYLSDKSAFKRQLARAGLPVIPEYQTTPEFIEGKYGQLPYPLVVKPVDSGGSLGITIVESRDDLPAAVERATNASHSRRIQLEKYMRGDIVACYYTIIDGTVFLSSIEDNLFSHKQQGRCPVTTGHRYASRYYDLYMEKAHDKMCALLNHVDARNGILQINAFVEDGEFYFYDPGYRFQGEAQHHILMAVNGFDHKEMLVNFAFAGKMYDGDFSEVNDPLLKGKQAASIWILLKAGKIASIEGLDEIARDPRVIYNGQRLGVGEEVDETMLGTEKQVLTRLYAVCVSRKELASLIDDIHRIVQVRDATGRSLIVDMLELNTVDG